MKNEGEKLALKVIKTTTRTVIISNIIPAMFAQKKEKTCLYACKCESVLFMCSPLCRTAQL